MFFSWIYCALMIYFCLKGYKSEMNYIFRCINSYQYTQLEMTSTSSPVNIKTSIRINQNWTEPTTNSIGILSALTVPIQDSICSNVSSPRERKIVLINTTAPVSIIAVMEQEKGIQTMLLLPVDELGKNYYIASWKHIFGYSYVALTSLENDTVIIFILPKDTSATVGNQTFNSDQFIYRSLKKYQTLNIYSRDDLTGGYIVTSHKIAVISGTTVDLPLPSPDFNNTTPAGDTVMEMIPPLESWGKRHICFPFLNTNTSIKIIAGYANTTVTIENLSIENITNHTFRKKGEFITMPVETLTIVTSSSPVMVAAYSLKGTPIGNVPSAMIILTPVEQWNRFYSFNVPARNMYSHFITILCKTEAIKSFLVDFEPLEAIWISKNNYSSTSIPISEGFHHIYNTIPSTRISLSVYGNSEIGSSYGFAVNIHLSRLYDYCENSTSEVDDGLDNDCDGYVDEERINALDDDEDGLIDEDCFDHFVPIPPIKPTVHIKTSTEASPLVSEYNLQLSVVLVCMLMGPIICGLLGSLLMTIIHKLHSGTKVNDNVKDGESSRQSANNPQRESRPYRSNKVVGIVDLDYV